eukprot:2503004-Alexandrium_andersonii.AAC.1
MEHWEGEIDTAFEHATAAFNASAKERAENRKAVGEERVVGDGANRQLQAEIGKMLCKALNTMNAN